MLWASLGRRWGPSWGALLTAISVTAAVFSAIQLVPAAGAAYQVGLGWLQAPFRGEFDPVKLTADPLDILALPALGLAAWAGRARCARTAPQDCQPAPGREANG